MSLPYAFGFDLYHYNSLELEDCLNWLNINNASIIEDMQVTTIFCSHATDCLLGTHRKPCVRPTSSRSYPITRLHMIDPSSLHNRRVINFTLEYCLSLNVALFANIFCRSISSEICKFFPPFVPSKAVVLHATVRAIKGRPPSCHCSCLQTLFNWRRPCQSYFFALCKILIS